MSVLLGQLWLYGASIQWPVFYSQERRRRIALPTYPFERQRYWIEPQKRTVDTPVAKKQSGVPDRLECPDEVPIRHDSALASSALRHPRPNLRTAYVPPATKMEKSIAAICTKVLGITNIGVDDIFFDLGADSFMALQAVAELKRELGIEVPVATLYEKLTIRSLATLLQSGDGNRDSDEPIALDESRQDRVDRRRRYQQKKRSNKRVGA
jgi:acyl carrier protein